jgi:peptidyl-dipeptidase A
MVSKSANLLLEEISSRFGRAEADFHRAYWDSQVEASPENDRRREAKELEVRKLKGDPATYQEVRSTLEDEVHDPLVRRQLEILQLSLTANQMDEADRIELVRLASSIESEFASFRPHVGGRSLNNNEIDEILHTSADSGYRRSVWSGSKQVGHRVMGSIRELVRLRNKVARDLGFADYYRMSLELQELSEEWLFERLDELDKATEPAFDAWKSGLDASLEQRFGVDQLEPWHYSDPFFQQAPPEGRITLDDVLGEASAPDLALKTFANWGVDISKVIEGSDLFPRDLKCQHAFCLDVDRSGDIRILTNIVPGERWVEVMLHESGHAAYDASIDPELPWVLRRAAHTFVTEAIAIFSGDMVRDPEWLVRIAGVPSSTVEPIAPALRAARAAQKLVFARWGLVMCHFERDLYSDPESDLDSRWWELVQELQKIDPPEDPPEGAWASKIHIAAAPVYYHNYLLGEMLAAQLRGVFSRNGRGVIENDQVGGFLNERIFRHGQLLRWDSLVEAAIGSGLSPSALVDSL